MLLKISKTSLIVQVVQDTSRALCTSERGPVSDCMTDWKGLCCPLRAATETDLRMVKICIEVPYGRGCGNRIASRMLLLLCSGCSLLKKVL